MQLNIMTWNTALIDKHIEKDKEDINKIIAYIQKFLQENTNAVAVLQEIPYKERVNWEEDPIYYGHFKEAFQGKKGYVAFANRDYNKGNLLMMTVIMTNITGAKAIPLPEPRELKELKEDPELKEHWEHWKHPLNRDCAVAVPCDGTNIVIYGIHALSKDRKKPYLNLNKPYLKFLSAIANKIDADIVLGDFNAGDYDKCENRGTFNNILPKYTCICNGPTREVKKNDKLIRESCIDHVFVKDELEANVSELIIHSNKYLPSDDKNLPSDHYPITFTLEISDRKGG